MTQWSRCLLTLARCRSVAANVFFAREAELAQEAANRIGVRLNTGCIRKSAGKFNHGHVAVLFNQFDQKQPMRIKLALAARTALRRGPCLSGSPDRKPPTRPGRGRKFQAPRRCASV